MKMNSKGWILNEDAVTLQDRTERLQWMSEISPQNDDWLFHGGILTKSLFEETRYCFVYGQFLAAITLGLSFLERTLASVQFGQGKDHLEREGVKKLCDSALEKGLITQAEYVQIEKARKDRNRILHFRQPGNEDTIEYISISNNAQPFALFEEEARSVIKIIFILLSHFSERF
jgi:hypothetical protein